MPTPLTERRTLTELIRRLHRTGIVDPADPLDGAELLVGWEAAVVKTADGWIHRFARTDRVTFERELVVLDLVDGRVPVPTPRVELVDHDELVMSYRTIEGASLDLPRVVGQDRTERAELVRSLAEALAAVHDLRPDAVRRLEVPYADHRVMADEVREIAAGRTGWVRRRLDELLAAWDDGVLAARSADPVLLQGDFHPGNMVFGSPTGPLSGMWDFTGVELGDPAADLRYLVGDSAELADEIAQAYAGITGRRIDVAAAALAGRLEAVTDAVTEGRPIEAELG